MFFGRKDRVLNKPSFSRGFDIADILEQGLARESCTEFLRPFKRASKLFRFYVTRSDDRKQFTMYTDDTDSFVMHVRFVTPDKANFYPYNSDDQLFNIDKPIFSMSRKNDAWTAYAQCCDQCHYKGVNEKCSKKDRLSKQEVVHMQHQMQSIGDGVFNSMESFVPGLYTDGSRVVWCPQVGYPPLGTATPEGAHHPHCIRLKTKEPRWNSDVECLVLEFKGRTIQPSAKNFQLSLAKKPEYIIMQFGKVTSNVFILDFRYPLSIIQAFSLALSTYHWK
eukprot:GHVL01010718.1.p1 GENE.GHVL01010718.1~~GHVL01010718.1.p1  ORF type:complete len:278 (-),score=26.69 GHVL01010718.1:287-1120(-)